MIENAAFHADDGEHISCGFMDDRSWTLITSAEEEGHELTDAGTSGSDTGIRGYGATASGSGSSCIAWATYRNCLKDRKKEDQLT